MVVGVAALVGSFSVGIVECGWVMDWFPYTTTLEELVVDLGGCTCVHSDPSHDKSCRLFVEFDHSYTFCASCNERRGVQQRDRSCRKAFLVVGNSVENSCLLPYMAFYFGNFCYYF